MRVLIQIQKGKPPAVYTKAGEDKLRIWHPDGHYSRRDSLTLHAAVYKGETLIGTDPETRIDVRLWRPRHGSDSIYLGRNGRGKMLRHYPGFRSFPLEKIIHTIDLQHIRIIDLVHDPETAPPVMANR